MQIGRQMETGEVIEDVVPSLTDTRITVTVNDDEKVEIRDKSLSLEEVIKQTGVGSRLEEQSSNRLFIISFSHGSSTSISAAHDGNW